MFDDPNRRAGFNVLIGLCALAITSALSLSAASAQDSSARASTAAAHKPAKPHKQAAKETSPYPDKPYFIEFRARSAYSYGHTFLVHGRVGQKITADDVIGLHPFTESPIPWMIGHIIPVPSETGASDGDYEDEYIIARYRIYLSEAEYQPILATMREWQKTTPLWHAAIYNCNAFVGSVARYMGFKIPFHLLYPQDYIETMKAMNGGRDVLNPDEVRTAATSDTRRQAAAGANRQHAAASQTRRREATATGAHAAARQAAPASVE
jgi:hypothetical protein